ncbi:autotransporter-associated beta strand repeat-containing protein [Lysobacter sp. FW306-1B-D06B]|uniref:autotransporter-associated beta strand repeat-containing protein n=1 Tax=Lysobacter sp. FW306-1B-D06B TaxID=3140250 RepID=UPI00314050FB
MLAGALAQNSGNTAIDALVLGISTDPLGQPTNGTLLVSGGSLTIDTSLTIGSFGAIGQVNQSGGDVRIFAGCGDVARCASLNIGNQGGTGTYTISGGSLVFDGPGFVILGRNDGANASTGILNLSGTGQVTVNQGQIVVGNNLAASNPGSGTINQTGGTFTVANAANLFLGGSGTGTYNLASGTLQIGGSSLTHSYLNLGGSYAFNLSGGTVQVIGSTLNTSVDATLLAGTTSTIDTNGFGANWSGVLSGGGGLTKTGVGTLTLTQPIGYSGLTTISAGTLALTGASQVFNGGVLVDAAGIFDIAAVTGSIPPAFPGPAIVLPSLTGTGTVNVGTTSLALNLASNEAFGGAVNLGGEG